MLLLYWWSTQRPPAEKQSVADTRPGTPIPPLASKAATSSPTPGRQAALPNIDRRTELPNRQERLAELESSRAARRAAASQITDTVAGARVDFDETLVSPKFIASTRGFLASADGSTGAVPAERLAKFAADDSQGIVKAFIDEYAAVFGHTSAALQEAQLIRDYETPHNGLRTMVWQQQLEGIRVFESTLQAHVTKAGALVNIASRFIPNAAAAAPAQGLAAATPRVDVKTAISAAGADVGETLNPAQVAENAPPAGPSHKQTFRSSRLLDTTAENVWLPIDEGSLRLTWEVTFTSKSRGEMFRTLVDADTGSVLVRQCLTNYISNASYRVYTSDSPTPMSPGLATPAATQPAEAARTLVTLSALDTTASPNGWIDDGVNETRGNNVDAHLDLNSDNVADTPRPQGSPNRVFDFALDLTQAPSAYQNAAVTQLFYWNNYIHDRYYQLGFTEAAGNFQNNNFGRGGTGNDAVQADAQDGSGTNNANFSTPSDGSPGRMQMYIFTGPTPDRDGDLDQEIVIHEYTHGLSNRLVGAGVGISALQTGGMGEGWSDFYGLCLLSEAGDNPDGNYAAGAYASYLLSTTLTSNYYYGIRRYPYSTDLTKNPLTFKDIDPTKASPHTGIPLSPRYTVSNASPSEVHGQGEVWCVTLWDVRANLVRKLGLSAGNTMALQLVTDGMKLAPANPTFLQARDGIIQADLVNNAGANSADLWSAFAKRGMGSSATSPSSSTTTGVVEAFDTPTKLIVNLPATVTEGGAPTTGTVTATPVPSTNLTVTLSNSNPAQLTVPASLIIAAGQTSTTFAVAAVDDTLLDGSPAVTVSPSGSGYNPIPGSTVVVDNETTTLTLALPTSATEGDAGLTGTVTAANVAGAPVVVALNSSDTTELTVPATVTIPSGQTSATFALTVVDDGIFDGAQVVTVTATVPGWTPGNRTMVVNNNNRSAYTITADDRGWYQQTGTHTPTNLNFLTGFSSTSNVESRSFYVFPIPALAPGETILSAELRLQNPTNGFTSPDASETLQFQDVTTPISSLVGGTGGVAAFTDLGNGTVFGSRSVSAADNGTTVVVPLNAAFVSTATAAAGGQLAVGGQLTTLTRTAGVGEFVFGFTSDPQTTQLVLTTSQTNLTVILPPVVTEGDAPPTGAINASPAPSNDLVVNLSSTNPGRLSVPSSVTIPAGATSTTFSTAVNDDALLNGTSSVTVLSSADGWASQAATIVVNDNETAVLTVSLPASVTEGVGSVTGTITASAAVDVDVAVQLTSSDPSEITVPASVTILAGQVSAPFTVTIVNDTRIDGAKDSSVTAHVGSWTDGAATITVLDNENTNLAFTLPASVREGDTGKTGTVRISGTIPTDLVVSLSSDDSTEIAVPATVTIPARQVSATFPLTVVDDTVADGGQTVTVSGSAAGFTSGSGTITVADNDADHFTITPIPPSVLRGSPVAVTVTARDANDVVITNYTETVNLGAKVPVTPGTAAGFVNGVLVLNLTFGGYGSDVVLTVSDTGGHTGTSNPFTVTYGPVSSLTWTTIPSPQYVDAPFPVTLRAVDSVGNSVPTFTGTADLSVLLSSSASILTWTAYADVSTSGEYQQTKRAISTYFPNYTETATTTTDATTLATALAGKQVFLVVEQENSSTSVLDVLGTTLGPVLSAFVNSGGTIIVCSYATSEHLLLTKSGLLDVTPVSTPASATIAKVGDDRLNAGITAPFIGSSLHTYTTTNGLVSLRTTSNEPVVISRDVGAGHVVLIGTDFNTIGTGMDRVIANAVALGAVADRTAPVSPARTGAFVEGEWTGNVDVPIAATSLQLRATSGVLVKDSNPFAVAAALPPSSAATVFSEDFESGVFSSAWNRTGTGNFRTQITNYSPHGGTRHMAMDEALDSGVYARNEVTLTLDLAGRTGVVLRFWAAQFGEEADGPPPSPFPSTGANFDGVAISADGGNNWYEVQSLRTLTTTYTQLTVDLDAAIAARGLSYTGNFKIRFNQYDNFSLGTDGIGIDDISVTANVPPTGLALNLPSQVVEGAGGVTCTVSVPIALATDLILNLSSKSPAKVTAPPSVTIPAGQTSANFTMTVLDDTFVDGTKNVVITASGPGILETGATMQVLDNDGGALGLTLAAAVTENAGTVTGTVTLSAPTFIPLTVALVSSNPLVAQAPASVLVPAGATSALFSVVIPDDGVIDGDQGVQFTASLAGWTPASADLVVQDNENRDLTVTIPARFRESDSPKTGTVSLSGTLAADLVVSLASSDTTAIIIPGTVTLLPGQTTVSFPMTIVDDTIADGAQPFTITASAANFTNGTASGVVRDNEAHHFTFAPIGSPELQNGPIPAVVTACDPFGAVLTDYTGTITLSASGSGGPLAVTPASSAAFVNGVWNGSVQINSIATNVILTASDGQGHTGSSNAFDLVAGAMSQFIWDPVTSPQVLDTPFTATVRAADAGGATVANYNGMANLFVLAPSVNSTIGTGNTTLYPTLHTAYQDCRSESIYLASELGGPAKLSALAYNVSSIRTGGEILTNLTIRLKQTTLADLGAMSTWDNTGWTQVYRASPTVSATGWVTFVFTTPYDYDGVSNLLVDVSFDRTATNSSFTYLQATSTGTVQTRYGISNSTNGDPLTWSGTVPSLNAYYQRADLRFTTLKGAPIRPAQSGTFTNGVWTGLVSVPVAGTALSLKAQAGTITGAGNFFDVSPPPPPSTGAATVFSEDFESGTLAPWTITGTGNYHTINSNLNTPQGGARHMTMDVSPYTGAYARNEATLALNLAGRSGVTLSFWARGYNDSPNGPPTSPFPGTGSDFDGVAISADGGTNWYEVQGLRSLTSSYVQYTVNLDAALTSRGLNYTSNFKIRFNQYGYNYIPYNGIGIDDILVTANPLSGFNVAAPAQVTEGAGAVAARASLSAVAATDTEMTLTSSAPAKIMVPASVTIPAGQTSVNFTFNVLEDNIVDGNRTVAITGTVSGQLPRSALVTVVDNDTLPLSLTAPATVAEGAAQQTGTLLLGAPASTPLSVTFTSSDVTELTVPANVVIPAGQQAVTFPITIVDDTQIDGTQTATIAASIADGISATATVQVTDNENHSLTMSGPYSVYEGQTSSGTVYLSGTLSSNLVVTLTSTNPTQYSVPASVTIPAGQTSASFVGTAVDDTATDGTQSATITASASTFTSAATSASAYDNEVHHFTFATIAAPQKVGIPFSATITARDLNNSTIATFTGTVALSATGTGGPVVLSPTTTGSFSSGMWTGNVTCNTARTNVQLTAASGSLVGTSNTFDVQLSPSIAVSPASIALTLNQGDTATRTATVSNTGGGTLTWSLATGAALTEVVSRGPDFAGHEPIVEDKTAVAIAPVAPDGAGIYAESRVGSVADASATALTLQSVLNNLNANYGLVRGAIPTRYAFTEGVTGTNISDGSGDMYDGGNYLSTNLGTYLNYSDNAILASSLLGTGGQFFTRKYDGLWVFAADVNGLSYFDITGNLGADGSGATDSAVLSVVRDGVTYRGFVKRVYNAGDPSVNHLIVVADNGGVTHAVSTDTNDDYHRLTNLSGVTRIYHVLYAGTGGSYIDNAATLNIMTSFLDAISAPDWVSPNPYSGSVFAGSSQNVTLTINSAGLSQGTYSRTLVLTSNDPLQPTVSLPMTLTVLGVANLAVSPSGGLSGSGLRGGPFAPASQNFTISNVGGQPLSWTATKSAAWLDLSSTSGSLNPGESAVITASLNTSTASLISGSYADTLTFTNLTNGAGSTTRPVTLTITPAGELVVSPPTDFPASGNFGGPFTPANRDYTLTNTGDAPLHWSASKSASWLALSVTQGTLAPGASTVVAATIAASALDPGSYSASISFADADNGRGNTTRNATLAVVLPAPVFTPEPPISSTTSNTVSWTPITGADLYEVVASTDPTFSFVQSSGWIGTTSFTFASLTDGLRYYFRVRSRRLVAEQTGTWSQSTQAELNEGTKIGVATTPTGSATLDSGNGSPIVARPLNASFENGTISGPVTDWTIQTTTNMGAYEYATAYSPMPTAGSRFLITFTFYSTAHVPGDSAGATQLVDFTGVKTLVFDAKLMSSGAWSGSIAGEVRIDGTPVWSNTAQGSYQDQSVDVSSYTGNHTLEFRNAVKVAGTYDSQWALWDNVRLLSPSGYLTSGTLTSSAIAPTPRQRWGSLLFSKDVSAAGTSLTVDVLDAAGSLLATNVLNGTDLNGLPAVASQPTLRLRANFVTTDTASTPRLDDWSIGYVTSLAQNFISAWSGVVDSVQDATAPSLFISSPNRVSASNYTLVGTAGDLFGVRSVTVNGITAATSDSFAHWSINASLIEGVNSFTLITTDSATPANVRTLSFAVIYAPSDLDGNGLPDSWEAQYGLTAVDTALGDHDHDGTANILEYAFGLDPTAPDSSSPYWTTIETKPADNQRYLVLHYRHRIGLVGWSFDLETSPDARQWSTTSLGCEASEAPTTLPDGVTEIVHCRVLQPITTGGVAKTFVRLRLHE